MGQGKISSFLANGSSIRRCYCVVWKTSKIGIECNCDSVVSILPKLCFIVWKNKLKHGMEKLKVLEYVSCKQRLMQIIPTIPLRYIYPFFPITFPRNFAEGLLMVWFIIVGSKREFVVFLKLILGLLICINFAFNHNLFPVHC